MDICRDGYTEHLVESEYGNEVLRKAVVYSKECIREYDSAEPRRIFNGKFTKLKKLGYGSYGTVYLVTNQEKKLFAMKKYYFDSLKGDNLKFIESMTSVVNSLGLHSSLPIFYDCFYENFNYYLVQDYYPMSLTDILKRYPNSFAEEDKQELLLSILFLLAEAVNFLHSRNVIHRDLKPDNIMISNKGEVKILDFDLAIRIDSENEKLSTKVGTLIYKPVELLFGETCYGYSLDIWALGCIFSELYLGYPIFQSISEIELLCKITEVLGAPTEVNYEGVSKLESFICFNNPEKTLFHSLFEGCHDQLKSLIADMLVFDPKRRISSKKILSSSIFDGLSKEKCIEYVRKYLSESLI